MQFQAYVERQFNTQIKMVQSDWEGEYQHLFQHFKTIGIHHRVAYSHTHQQMGAIERRHRQVVEMGLSLLSQIGRAHV